ncbi:DUF3025 domain-containing protein [Steroidobacter sp.]|uniref:DUF3025 domain-containing protein n=1 Tax=Steroidobacter sp. TaxID=1978227 RepID=UPI001A53DE7F|nr:DUF3025 domain-containing protein [Steroidobacter sp.]MBL8271204.1 DUF3025 domain-containing protein [Steroidobacter sp.]
MTVALASLAEAMKAPAPWFLPYLPVAQRVLAAPSSSSVADALNAAVGDDLTGLRFVEQAALPEGESYEAFIFRTGCVPTRDNLHDLFNGLMWLAYPKAKRRLNVLQADEIKQRGGANGTRGPLRDALTLFDENAAILQAPAALIEALRARQWTVLFEEQRAQWQSARLRIFGHALLEKLQQPRKAITAHVWVIADLTDEALASSLVSERLAAKDFLPLPVLGVPGWWPDNATPGFYDDADVFRPLRR